MRMCVGARFRGCACFRHEYLEDRARAVVEHAVLVGSAGGPRPRQRLVERGGVVHAQALRSAKLNVCGPRAGIVLLRWLVAGCGFSAATLYVFLARWLFGWLLAVAARLL